MTKHTKILYNVTCKYILTEYIYLLFIFIFFFYVKTNKKSVYSLLELIIVITILAILATIGFMSYQSYTMDARDGKRSTDISSLQSKLEVTVAKNATPIVNFASGIANQITWVTLIWTWIATYAASKYAAWDVDYTDLGVSSTDFSDPGTAKKSYKFGWAITASWSMYQFAATLEWGDAWKKALVKGLFLTASWDTAKWLISWTGTNATVWVLDGSTVAFSLWLLIFNKYLKKLSISRVFFVF